jgi:hypothetical protein
MASELFERATRKKYRFNSPMGELTVEQLWGLPLTSTNTNVANLDDIAIQLHQVVESTPTTSFVKKNVSSNSETKDKLDIVVHVIDTKITEAEESNKRQANKQTKQQLLALVEQKKLEALGQSSIDELLAQIAKLED